ncbi:hypothetical protein D9M68_570880 [compost metagenome]
MSWRAIARPARAEGSVMAFWIEVSIWRWYSSSCSAGKLALRTISSASAVSSGRFSPLVDIAIFNVVPLPLKPSSACSASRRSWMSWRDSLAVPRESRSATAPEFTRCPRRSFSLPNWISICACTRLPRVALGSSASCTGPLGRSSFLRCVSLSIFSGEGSKADAALKSGSPL